MERGNDKPAVRWPAYAAKAAMASRYSLQRVKLWSPPGSTANSCQAYTLTYHF